MIDLITLDPVAIQSDAEIVFIIFAFQFLIYSELVNLTDHLKIILTYKTYTIN